jgi:23S rRNA pseudouridine2457 synthase
VGLFILRQPCFSILKQPVYYIIYKPFQVLSQFSKEGDKATLKDFFNVPPDVYPVGRLDYDSEGLLILTNDTTLNKRLLQPAHAHEREYWAQVEGVVSDSALHTLRTGVSISVNGVAYPTLPCRATLFAQEPVVPVRNPPIRYRKNISTAWISLCLTEGKNRQVRKMTAAVGLPTLRLIRTRIEKITIEGLEPGSMRQLTQNEIYPLLFG